MRAVITGTDYIKDIDGSFKAIETNTNVGLSVDCKRYFDIDNFDNFVSENQINEIAIIYNDANLQMFKGHMELESVPVTYVTEIVDTDGRIPDPNAEGIISVTQLPDGKYEIVSDRTGLPTNFVSFLKQYYKEKDVIITSHKINETSITIPDVEDSPNKLIIRIAFDTTALIDDVYARDNWEFLKLMHDTDSTSIPKTYINDVELGFDSIGNTLRDNGNQPNYCIKKRITPADNNVYPKLLKVTSVEQLDLIKAELEVDEYLQEFIYNPSDLLNNKIKIYRSVDMVYGGELDVLNFWVMEHSAMMDIIDTPDYDDNNEIQIWDRNRYTTKFNSKTSDVAIKLSADTGTKILDTNNDIIFVENLTVGDLVKSVNVPGMINGTNTSATLNWVGDVTDIISNSTVTQSQLVSKTETDYFGLIIEFELENGSVFSDVPHAKIMIEAEISGSTVSVFRQYNDLNVGNTILVWDNLTNTIIKNDIVDIRYSYQKLKAYTLNVEEFDLFLTLEESDGNRYGLLTHNYNYDCIIWSCGYWGQYLPGTGAPTCGSGDFLNPCFVSTYCLRSYGLALPPSCQYFSWNGCAVSGNQALQYGYCNDQKPSDVSLKENVKFLYQTKDGLNVYEYEYNDYIKSEWKNKTGENLIGKWRGVMAQELLGTKWEMALTREYGDYYVIDYNKLPNINK